MTTWVPASVKDAGQPSLVKPTSMPDPFARGHVRWPVKGDKQSRTPEHAECRAVGDPPEALQRAEITQQEHSEPQRTPVVTLVASYGLGLPAHPSDRVLLADVGCVDVDLRAVWDEDVSPPAQPGDWWLVLPIVLSRDDVPVSQSAVVVNDGASHALIDSAGRRLIEPTGFVATVTDTPPHCDQRPDPSAGAGTVAIESRKVKDPSNIAHRQYGKGSHYNKGLGEVIGRWERGFPWLVEKAKTVTFEPLGPCIGRDGWAFAPQDVGGSP